MTHVPPADAGRLQRTVLDGATKNAEVSGLREKGGAASLASDALDRKPAVLAPRDVPGPVSLQAQALATPAAMFKAALHAGVQPAAILHGALRAGHSRQGLARLLLSPAYRSLPGAEQHAQALSIVPMVFKAFGG
jgi:hypothetical protein